MREKSAPAATCSEHEFDELRILVERRSGILFDASRERFFSSRVHHYISEKRLGSGSDLLRRVLSSNVEYDTLLESLLTQETSFFRYPGVFEALRKKVWPHFQIQKFWDNPRTLRVWSAGCATGEESYSIAISLDEHLPSADAWKIEILATDISRQALCQAERGVYPRRSLGMLPPAQIENHFIRAGEQFTIKPQYRRWVSFAQMNLAQAVYVGRQDCIFCMNVLIYFSEERRRELIRRFYDSLEPGGYLFLGHAESIAKAPVRFEPHVFGDCIYYRKPASEAVLQSAAAVEEKV
jgi:chemotaxis protein methyltransferase CheR